MLLSHLLHVLPDWHAYAHHCHRIVTGPILKGHRRHLVCSKPGYFYPF